MGTTDGVGQGREINDIGGVSSLREIGRAPDLDHVRMQYEYGYGEENSQGHGNCALCRVASRHVRRHRPSLSQSPLC